MASTQKKRKIQISAQAKFDLHGFSVETAYSQCRSKLQAYQDRGLTIVEVVTGQSGQIRYEFPFWMEQFGYRAQVSKSNGSFYVYL